MPEIRNPFSELGISHHPLILAPLAGVSDEPFRRMCALGGAHLTYVEMLSATALLYENKRTHDMMRSHESENVGAQVTGRSASDVGKAVEILHRWPFKTIDINMGCPVRKVVDNGSGSAILKDPQRVYDTVKAAVSATNKPVSAKIRLGWCRSSVNAVEIAQAIEQAGASWITVHGRTRSEGYSVPVDLDGIASVRKKVSIPVIGNGNVFGKVTAQAHFDHAGVDGVMVSRGAMGNPWVFDEISGIRKSLSLGEWLTGVLQHIQWQREHYGVSPAAAIVMRKHLHWYVKGWPNHKRLRDGINVMSSLDEGVKIIENAAETWAHAGVKEREMLTIDDQKAQQFLWEPKWDMDRVYDSTPETLL